MVSVLPKELCTRGFYHQFISALNESGQSHPANILEKTGAYIKVQKIGFSELVNNDILNKPFGQTRAYQKMELVLSQANRHDGNA